MKCRKKHFDPQLQLNFIKPSSSPLTDQTYSPNEVPRKINTSWHQMLDIIIVTTYWIRNHKKNGINNIYRTHKTMLKDEIYAMVIFYTQQNAFTCVIMLFRDTSSTCTCALIFPSHAHTCSFTFAHRTFLVTIVSYLVLSIYTCTMLQEQLANIMITPECCLM